MEGSGRIAPEDMTIEAPSKSRECEENVIVNEVRNLSESAGSQAGRGICARRPHSRAGFKPALPGFPEFAVGLWDRPGSSQR